MSARSKRPSYAREVVVGLIVSLVAAAGASALSFVLPPGAVARALAAGVGLVFVLRALASSEEKSGRVVAVLVWIAAAVSAWYGGLTLPAYVGAHVAMIWLARALFVHRTFVEALVDLGLAALGISFAAWAIASTNSPFLATWCFCLVQAGHVGIPALAGAFLRREREETVNHDSNRRFADARSAAEEALRRIAAR